MLAQLHSLLASEARNAPAAPAPPPPPKEGLEKQAAEFAAAAMKVGALLLRCSHAGGPACAYCSCAHAACVHTCAWAPRARTHAEVLWCTPTRARGIVLLQ